jgi:hypothetical protein
VRKAYARLIKVYRPDRSPEAFQRVHAAYEELTAAPRRGEKPVVRIASNKTATGTSDKLVAAVLAASISIDPTAGDAVAAGLGRDRAWWEAADHDRDHAELSWRIVAALSWLTPVAALRERLLATPWPWRENELVDHAEIEIACAAALRTRGGTPRELAATLVARWLAPPDELSRRGYKLARCLRDAPYTYLELFQTAFESMPVLADELEARLADDTGEPRKSAGAATSSIVEQIRAAVGATSHPRTKRDTDRGLGLVGIVGVLGFWIAAKSQQWSIAIAIGGGALVLGMLSFWLPRRFGSTPQRQRCARLVTRVGITVGALLGQMPNIAALRDLSATLIRAVERREPGLVALAAVSAWAATLAERDET